MKPDGANIKVLIVTHVEFCCHFVLNEICLHHSQILRSEYSFGEVDKSFLNPFLWTEPPVNPHNGIVEQVGLTSQEKYERYATDKIETFAIFRSKGIHLLQSGEKYVKSKLNQLFLPNLNGFYTNDKGFLFGNCPS